MPDDPRAIADILDKAAELIKPEGAWTQGAGGPCKGGAESNCAYTAIMNVAHSRVRIAASDFFAKYIGGDHAREGAIWDWNDAPDRTQSEVVAKLHEAASKAREEASHG